MLSILPDLLSSGVSLFGQRDRLLRLRFGEESGIDEDVLLPHRVVGEEALSRLYRYTLDCLSVDAYLELKELLGQPIEVAILLADGGERLLTGLVTRAEQAGADGGFAKYVLTIEPALATLAYRRNSRVFQELAVPQIVAAILDEHLAANPAIAKSFHTRNELGQSYPRRSYCLQYRESDLAFITRLLAEEGISYRFTHGPDPKTSLRGDERAGDESDIPLHTLILFDGNAQLPESAEDPIRYHRTDGVESKDAIDQWQGRRQIHSSQSQLSSYDYKAVATHVGDESTRTQGAVSQHH